MQPVSSTAKHRAGPGRARAVVVVVMAASLLAAAGQALAQRSERGGVSALSALSLLPVALVGASAAGVAAGVVAGGAALTVTAVQASADGTEWVLTRASDGAQVSVHVAGEASVAVGELVTVTAVTGGLLLSAAGRVIAWIPDQLGRALSHHERVTR